MATTKKTASKPAKKAAPAKPAAAKKTAPVKKTVATKKAVAPAKKAAPKKATPVKAAAKKVAPAKVTSKKAAAKAAPKKAAPKKAAPQKAVAKVAAPKATVKTTAKKVSPAKAAPKKAAPVKKAAPAKVAAKPVPKAPEKKTTTKSASVKDMTSKKTSTSVKGTAKETTKAKPAAAPAKKSAAGLPTRKSPVSPPPPPPKPEIRDAVRAKPRVEMSKPGVIAHRKLEKKEKVEEQPGLTMKEYNPTKRSLLDEPEQNLGPVYRYSDEELNEFKELISKRLESARENLSYYQALITRKDEAGTDDTDNRFNHLEDGSGAMEREQLSQLAGRQIQFINHLEKALIRIENKTYGICRVTGKLIDKARLRAVPHATLSIEAKNTMNK